MRYICQHDDFNCGPIALMNLHKWQGLSATKKDLRRYTRLCKCTKSNGTTLRDFSKAIGKRSKKVTYSEFKKMVDRGSVILLIRRFGKDGHYWFCPGIGTRVCDNKKGFIGVNFGHFTMILISWQYMRSLLRYCVVWSFE